MQGPRHAAIVGHSVLAYQRHLHDLPIPRARYTIVTFPKASDSALNSLPPHRYTSSLRLRPHALLGTHPGGFTGNQITCEPLDPQRRLRAKSRGPLRGPSLEAVVMICVPVAYLEPVAAIHIVEARFLIERDLCPEAFTVLAEGVFRALGIRLV